jgi:hypothetical protein
MLLALVGVFAAMGMVATASRPGLSRAEGERALDSGIEGHIEIRPVRSVQRGGDANSAPYQATVTVLDGGGNTVTTFTSDEQGNFRAPLAPGTYTLRPESTARYPRASTRSVVVAPRAFTRVDIVYDSGRR